MRNDRINYIVVGSFVLAMLAALAVTVAVLTGRTGATDTYYVEYRNVTGLQFGTQVLYEGYPVGQVEEIQRVRDAEGGRYRLEVSVRQGWAIPEDSTAVVTAPGLLAATTIDIHAGSEATALAPGGMLRGVEPINVFDVVSSVAGDVSELTEESVKPLLLSLAQRLPAIAQNLEEFSVTLNQSGQRIGAFFNEANASNVERTLRNLEATSASAARLAEDLGETRAELHGMLERVHGLVERNEGQLAEAVADVHYALESVARNIDSVNHNLEGASRNMNEFARQIRNNPALLLSGRPPEDAAPAASGGER